MFFKFVTVNFFFQGFVWGKVFETNGVPLVGYWIFYDHVLIRGNTLRRMQKNYRNKFKAQKEGKITPEKLRVTESAFYGHFNHADTNLLTLDQG